MYCIVCHKEVKAERKTTSWFYDRNMTYERDVCPACDSEMLIQKQPSEKDGLEVL